MLGLAGTVPLIALRKEFDPDAGDELEPTYFGPLIDMPTSQLDPSALWVREHQLFYGQSAASAPLSEMRILYYTALGRLQKEAMQ